MQSVNPTVHCDISSWLYTQFSIKFLFHRGSPAAWKTRAVLSLHTPCVRSPPGWCLGLMIIALVHRRHPTLGGRQGVDRNRIICAMYNCRSNSPAIAWDRPSHTNMRHRVYGRNPIRDVSDILNPSPLHGPSSNVNRSLYRFLFQAWLTQACGWLLVVHGVHPTRHPSTNPKP